MRTARGWEAVGSSKDRFIRQLVESLDKTVSLKFIFSPLQERSKGKSNNVRRAVGGELLRSSWRRMQRRKEESLDAEETVSALVSHDVKRRVVLEV